MRYSYVINYCIEILPNGNYMDRLIEFLNIDKQCYTFSLRMNRKMKIKNSYIFQRTQVTLSDQLVRIFSVQITCQIYDEVNV